MTKSIEDHAAELTQSLSAFEQTQPENEHFPTIAQKIRTSREHLLRALLDEDVEWDTNSASPLAKYLPLIDRADAAYIKAEEVLTSRIPQAEKKEVRKHTVRRIDVNRTFASAHEFRRAAERVNGISTHDFTQTGEPKLSTPMMLDKIAEFCSVYLSLTRDELSALPGTDKERRRSLDWYDRFRPVAENIRDAESSKDWLQIMYKTPSNPNLTKDWDTDEGDAE